KYRYNDSDNDYSNDENSQNASASGNDNSGPLDQNGTYRLGPDCDVLAGGKVVMHLTDKTYLMLTTNSTQVIDQDSGKIIMTLANDPSLYWHIGSEIKRQALGLQAASHDRQSSMDWSGSLSGRG